MNPIQSLAMIDKLSGDELRRETWDRKFGEDFSRQKMKNHLSEDHQDFINQISGWKSFDLRLLIELIYYAKQES